VQLSNRYTLNRSAYFTVLRRNNPNTIIQSSTRKYLPFEFSRYRYVFCNCTRRGTKSKVRKNASFCHPCTETTNHKNSARLSIDKDLLTRTLLQQVGTNYCFVEPRSVPLECSTLVSLPIRHTVKCEGLVKTSI